MAPDLRWLDIRNNGGSVEHYYHFLLGYLLPLCAYVGQSGNESSILLARACGPLSHLVCELGIPGLLLCERQSHSDISRKAEDIGLQKIDIAGLDYGPSAPTYDADRVAIVVNEATHYIRQRLGSQIKSLCESWSPSAVLRHV
jgi:hypothetical protein